MKTKILVFFALVIFSINGVCDEMIHFISCADCSRGWYLDVLNPAGGDSYRLKDDLGFSNFEGDMYRAKAFSFGKTTIIYSEADSRFVAIDFSSKPKLLMSVAAISAASSLDNHIWALRLPGANRRENPKKIAYVDFSAEGKIVQVFGPSESGEQDLFATNVGNKLGNADKVGIPYIKPDGSKICFIHYLGQEKKELVAIELKNGKIEIRKKNVLGKFPSGYDKFIWEEDSTVTYRREGRNPGSINISLP